MAYFRTYNQSTKSWEIFDIVPSFESFEQNILTRSLLRVNHVIDKSTGFGVSPEAFLEKQKKKTYPYIIPWVIVLCVHFISMAESSMFYIYLFICKTLRLPFSCLYYIIF